ncbi:basic amino acid ABC transporter substrate-binding protein [Thermoactinomyces sp. AMNI-1]|uniref:Basic amino acid ABC transporter substrate-binding protein n=2 Tax=Thermoactinomyces mirandus TaxID=2756294 RepID=A0A7W2AT84_9BACL|nr:basic amino acid ABC transporter substrate-binding protein [Thermoactinomyces mirandus]
MLVAVTGCSSQKADNSIVNAGTNAEFPPFEKLEGNGEITGFDAELIQAIAKAENLQLDFQHYGWDSMLNGVARGRIDMGIAAITITDERKRMYDFTEPYFEAKQVILVPKTSPVQSLNDLKGKKIGVQSATTGEKVVQEAFGKTYPGLQRYDVVSSAIDDLKWNRLDAVVVDKAVNLEYIKRLGEEKYKIIEDPAIPEEYYGIIVKKGNRELLDKLNAGLKKIQENGTYDKIYNKYFWEN